MSMTNSTWERRVLLGLGFEHSPVDVIAGLEVIIVEGLRPAWGHSDKLAYTGSQTAHWYNKYLYFFILLISSVCL